MLLLFLTFSSYIFFFASISFCTVGLFSFIKSTTEQCSKIAGKEREKGRKKKNEERKKEGSWIKSIIDDVNCSLYFSLSLSLFLSLSLPFLISQYLLSVLVIEIKHSPLITGRARA